MKEKKKKKEKEKENGKENEEKKQEEKKRTQRKKEIKNPHLMATTCALTMINNLKGPTQIQIE